VAHPGLSALALSEGPPITQGAEERKKAMLIAKYMWDLYDVDNRGHQYGLEGKEKKAWAWGHVDAFRKMNVCDDGWQLERLKEN
jgi:hypothetical protein